MAEDKEEEYIEDTEDSGNKEEEYSEDSDKKEEYAGDSEDSDKKEEYTEDSKDSDKEVYEEPEAEEEEEEYSEDKQTDIKEYEDVVEDIEIAETKDDEIKYTTVEEEPVEIIKAGFPKEAPKTDEEEIKKSDADFLKERSIGFGVASAAEIKKGIERPEGPVYEPPYEEEFKELQPEKTKSIKEHIEDEIRPIPRESILRKPITVPDREVKEMEEVPQEKPKPPEDKKKPVSDSELKDLISRQRADIVIIGCGGAGSNTITRMNELGKGDVETIALNTDAQDLLYTNADKKILIGKNLTKGLGAGAIPKIGEDAAKEAEAELKAVIQGHDLIFITCGMGGGTGTGSAPVIADIAKKMGSLTIGIVTIPFAMEGVRRRENARLGLEKMQQFVDTLIIIPNDKLLMLSPDLPLHTAFKLADEILINAVKGIANLIIEPGLVNLDFADVRTVMSNAGIALIGVGESDTKQRASESVDKAMNNPLLDADISGSTGALINISGGPDMTLEEARFIVEEVASKLDDEARIIWGAQILEDLQDTIRVLLIVTGIKTQSAGSIPGRDIITQKRKREIESELDIEFV